MKSYSFKERKKSWPFADSKKIKIGIWDYEKKKKSPHKGRDFFLSSICIEFMTCRMIEIGSSIYRHSWKLKVAL